jgi:hypothetical protein
MRVPERVHKHPNRARPGYQRVLATTGAGTRLVVMSRVSGTSCMTTITAQRPMAVSIVAGRVFKRGVGACTRRSSVMANHSKIASSKERPNSLKYIGLDRQETYRGTLSNSTKMFQSQ